MNALLTIARKDLKLLARNKAAFFWVMGFPILMALFFGAIRWGGGGPGSIPVAAVDLDGTDYSRSVIERLRASEALRIEEMPLDSAVAAVRRGDLMGYVALRPGLSETFGFGPDSTSALEIGIDPRERATSGMLRGLVVQALFESMRGSFAPSGSGRTIIRRRLEELAADTTEAPAARARTARILRSLESFMTTLDSGSAPPEGTLLGGADTTGTADSVIAAAEPRREEPMGPNIRMVEVAEEETGPRTAYEVTFPSALAWALIGTCMSFAMSIVYERITGTFLRLRFAPVGRARVLGGKALACFLACLGSTALLLAIGRFAFGIRILDPLALLAAIAASAFCFTGLAMLVASIGRSHESVAGAGWALMLVLSMTGGGMMPLIAMPPWMQALSDFSLVKWAILGVEGAVWRGFGWGEMLQPLAILVAAGTLALAIGAFALSRPDR